VHFPWSQRAAPVIIAIALLIVFPRFLHADNPFDQFDQDVGWEEKCPAVNDASTCQFMIRIYGQIETATAERFGKALERWDHREYLFVNLNSLGGDVATAMKLGRLIRKFRGHTVVEGNATCASACVLIFAAGLSRAAFEEAKIGVHRPALASAPRNSDMATVQAVSDQIAQELRAYAAEMNVNGRLIDDMLFVRPENIRWLSAADRQAYGLGFLDPVYEETDVLNGAKKYNITPAEYRRRNALARSGCPLSLLYAFYGVLELEDSLPCRASTLASGKLEDWITPRANTSSH